MIGRAVRCSSGRPTPPRPGRSGRPSPWAARSFPVLIGAAAVLIGAGSGQKKSQGGRRRPFTLAFSFLLLIEAGRVLPGADRGRGRRALVPAAPDPPARGTGHGSRWHRSRAAQFRRRMIRQNAAGRRGQILHLTAYRPIGNGELGSMPPYYPPLAPFFPGFRRGESITGHSFGASLQDIGLHTLSSRLGSFPNCRRYFYSRTIRAMDVSSWNHFIVSSIFPILPRQIIRPCRFNFFHFPRLMVFRHRPIFGVV